MFREFLVEYKDGFVSSLHGFLLLYKLDRVEGQQVKEKRRISSNSLVKQTVLENRRQKNMEEKSIVETQKQPQQKVSTVYRVLSCALINILLVFAIMLLTFIIDLLNFFPTYLKYFGSIVFVVPIFIFIRCLSALWFADVANAALRYRGLSGTKLPVFSRAASDFVHAIFVELVFLAQAFVIKGIDIPLISPFLGFIYISLLHSLYSFDYLWMARGVAMNPRLAYIEQRWPFHLGFGTLLTLATSFSTNFVINGLIFGALFPFFIVSSFLTDSVKATGKTNGEIPPVHFYYIAQTITNKISLAIFGRLC